MLRKTVMLYIANCFIRKIHERYLNFRLLKHQLPKIKKRTEPKATWIAKTKKTIIMTNSMGDIFQNTSRGYRKRIQNESQAW